MIESWFFLHSPAADAATNMAVDETLLLGAEQRGRPLLRVYSWLRPAVSIGYFQKFPAHLAGLYEIVRRPTGGGLVYHGDDTTYTLVVPPSYWLFAQPVRQGYRLIHEAVARAIGCRSALLGATGHPIAPRRTLPQYDCFQNPVAGDVIAGGKKLAGAAQRRTKWGLLHQGSIAAHLSAEQLQEGFRRVLVARFEQYALSTQEQNAAEELARDKYATDAWNRRL
jgi:lipoate-protein ligase A